MSKTITLKYPGKCQDCGRKFTAGERALWLRRGQLVCVGDCLNEFDDDDYIERQIQARNNSDYEKGKAEARQYLNDKATYGRELAEAWEMEAEIGRYNRGEG